MSGVLGALAGVLLVLPAVVLATTVVEPLAAVICPIRADAALNAHELACCKGQAVMVDGALGLIAPETA